MDRRFRYVTGQGNSFEEQLKDLFFAYKPHGTPVRLVIFGNPADNAEYLAHLDIIGKYMPEIFGNNLPVFSYVAQAPLEHNHIEMETFEIGPGSGCQFYYRSRGDIPYLVLETSETRELYLGGVKSGVAASGIGDQADIIFSRILEIFNLEKMPVSSIVRQWNYIEGITMTDGGRQHYQEFNDARSRFYNTVRWENSYPAATGIGTSCGGVIVDVDAIMNTGCKMKVAALNNSLQVPAHAYSQVVLYGAEDRSCNEKSTPKFERAKVIFNETGLHIYISGTAAIRGEKSLNETSAGEQTLITLENIEHLISPSSLTVTGEEITDHARICSLRVYLKDECDFAQCREIISNRYPGIPAVYLKADICRDELLVEIEGFSYVRK